MKRNVLSILLVCLFVFSSCFMSRNFAVGASAMIVSNQYRNEAWSKPTWLAGLCTCLFAPLFYDD